MGEFTGRVAIVTGSSSGIGEAIARRLGALGAHVVVNSATSVEAGRSVAASIGDNAIYLQADIADKASGERLIDETVARFGRLDILVNNASTFYPTPVGEITEAHWDDLLGSNLKAPLFLSQAAAPALRLARGLIINIVDIHGMRPLRRYPVYGAAKAGLIMLTRSLARELGPQVRVNGIAPGPVMWPEDGVADAALQQKIVERTLLKRTGSADDIARTALFFAADAPYVTGQILAVDGGRSVGW